MMKHVTNEKGLALFIAILGLVVTGTAISAFVMAGVLERRAANSTRRMGQAFAAAEHGLNETVGTWDPSTFNLMTVGDSIRVSGATPSGVGSYGGWVTRLNDELYIVDIAGWDAAGGARQSVGALVKLRLLDMDIRAALTTRGPTRIGGSAQIDGNNDDPFGWTGCPADSDLAGVRVPHVGDLSLQGSCSDGSCIDGNPTIQPDPTLNDSTFFEYGDLDWDGLVAMATKILNPATYTGIGPAFTVTGACDLSVATNWGDPLVPTSTCGSYFPIMYVPGDMNISGGNGQGILLVDGSLSVQGGFQFFGIVIARQSLKTTGTGGHFHGAVMAANVDMDQNTVLGDALVQYSSCAAGRALNSAGTGAMLRSRGWMYAF